MELKLKEFRRLSKAEKKEFKKSGGKVKFSIPQKIGSVIIILALIALVGSMQKPEKTPEQIAAQKAKQKTDRAEFDAGTNCVIAAKKRVKIPDSFDYTQPSVTTLPAGKGYQVMLSFESKNAFGVSIPALASCVTDNAGKLNSIKISQ
ncbi:Uncharacterised protein [Yersinia frederiksenii]|nr:Uncharacterised protein [Yersinia frederiksenii]CNI12174.1 Uncharacterised protein [Yersinia frederiksenii]HDL7459197.1 hypothetical protein [Yersinia enterocolitica]HEN3248722.1 hypothetical protein [Yersinia enterocolitica]